jgi:hypothetical protein
MYLIMLIMVFIPSLVFGYSLPPDISVEKPSSYNTDIVIDDNEGGIEDYSICASGCDYTSIQAFESGVLSDPNLPVIVRWMAGTYIGNILSLSGTDGNEITWEPYGDGQVIFQAQNGTNFQFTGSYRIVDGGTQKSITFDGSTMSISPLYVAGDNIAVVRCNILHGGGQYNINGEYQASMGSVINGDNNRIYNCIIGDGNSYGLYIEGGDNNYVKNNIFYDIFGQGQQVNPHGNDGDPSSGHIISGNIFTECGHGYDRGAIALLSNDNTLFVAYIYNNIVFSCWEGIEVSDGSNGEIYLYNNTIYLSSNYGILDRGLGASSYWRNNISFNNNVSDTFTGGTVSNHINTDPLFASINSADNNFLNLTESSTNCIGQGYDVNPPVTIDYLGNIRDLITMDIGAFEYYTNQSTPTISGCDISGVDIQ